MSKKNEYKTKLRIYYEDTDAGGIVYHSKYLNFAERARTEFLRDKKIEQNTLIEKYGIIFVVKSLKIEYLSAARLDDIISIKTKIHDLNKVKVDFEHLIFKRNTTLAKIRVRVCCVNKNKKICRMNDKVYATLKIGKENL